MATTSRRVFLASTAAVAASAVLRPATAKATPRAAAARPEIRPRSEWGSGLQPRGQLLVDSPRDVKFLLVHHTETPNGYGPEKVAPRLQNIFQYHTGTKGWPDIAYNFFVDEHGRIWEGRTGSLDGPVRGDATGGSQGHAMLCCFLGNHSAVAPTPAAVSAMATLTAWLAGQYQIDLDAGPTISFTSRGSNRWPAGTVVTTDPIAGHRDMSQTACPGDAAYPLVRGAILQQAKAAAGVVATTTPPTTAPVATSTTASTSTTAAPTSSTIGTTSNPSSSTSVSAERSTTSPNPVPADSESGDGGSSIAGPLLGATSVAAAVGGAALVVRNRRARLRAASKPGEEGGVADGAPIDPA